uniref:Galectin n=1 Tax=Timema bartmani TaxID=61472 RepID=A0A7R9HXN6_9NEOP|nr:unnamed protein product [Timema bartmani]
MLDHYMEVFIQAEWFGFKELFQHSPVGEWKHVLGKTTLSAPDHYLNLDLPVIGSLVYCEIQTSTTPFSINLQCGPNVAPRDDIALHVSARFHENVISRNSLHGLNWGPDELTGHMPLARAQGFEIIILCEPESYKIAINGQHYTQFIHRIPYQHVTHISIDGDVMVSLIQFEGGSQGFAPPPGGFVTSHSIPGGYAPPMGGAALSYPPNTAPYPPISAPYPQTPGVAIPPFPTQPGYPIPTPCPIGIPQPHGGYPQAPYSGYGQSQGYPAQPYGQPYPKKAYKAHKKSSKALKYGLPIAGVAGAGLGAYALSKSFHSGSSSSSSSSSSSEEE